MAKILWNVDEKKYNDRNAHTLILTGWATEQGNPALTFFLQGDGEEISISQPERFDRADVARSLSELGEVRDAGFTLKIPEILTLAEKYTRLEVFLSDGSEKEVIFSSTGKELEDFCMDCLMEYRIDKEQILGKNTLLVEGWVLDQQGSDEVLVEDRAGKPVKCTINRGRRPDVEEERGITASGSREIGFSVQVDLEETGNKELLVCFKGPKTQKKYLVDVRKLKKEKSVFYQRMNLLSIENKDANRAYIKEKGLKEFLHYVATYQPDSVSVDYEEWLKSHAAGRKELLRQKKTVFKEKPLISIVIPLYNTPEEYLKELIDSVRAQTYTNWQLCLADGSEGLETRAFLNKKYRKENRITYKKLKENKGISENTNAAMKLAAGEYILLCDHDDVLTPDALFHIDFFFNDK